MRSRRQAHVGRPATSQSPGGVGLAGPWGRRKDGGIVFDSRSDRGRWDWRTRPAGRRVGGRRPGRRRRHESGCAGRRQDGRRRRPRARAGLHRPPLARRLHVAGVPGSDQLAQPGRDERGDRQLRLLAGAPVGGRRDGARMAGSDPRTGTRSGLVVADVRRLPRRARGGAAGGQLHPTGRLRGAAGLGDGHGRSGGDRRRDRGHAVGPAGGARRRGVGHEHGPRLPAGRVCRDRRDRGRGPGADPEPGAVRLAHPERGGPAPGGRRRGARHRPPARRASRDLASEGGGPTQPRPCRRRDANHRGRPCPWPRGSLRRLSVRRRAARS